MKSCTAILITDKIDILTMSITRNKQRDITMIKEINSSGEYDNPVSAYNHTASTYVKQEMTKIKRNTNIYSYSYRFLNPSNRNF